MTTKVEPWWFQYPEARRYVDDLQAALDTNISQRRTAETNLDRLYAENAQLRIALAGLLSVDRLTGEEFDRRVAAARAALSNDIGYENACQT